MATRARLGVVGAALSLGGMVPLLGGHLATRLVVSPTIFGLLGDPAAAGQLMQPVFLGLDRLYLASALVILLGEGIRAGALGQAALSGAELLRLPLAGGLTVLTAWGALVTHPRMAALRGAAAAGAGGDGWIRFDHLHRLSEGLANGVTAAAVALLLVAFWSAWRRAGNGPS